jgi:hypothetical protein
MTRASRAWVGGIHHHAATESQTLKCRCTSNADQHPGCAVGAKDFYKVMVIQGHHLKELLAAAGNNIKAERKLKSV